MSYLRFDTSFFLITFTFIGLWSPVAFAHGDHGHTAMAKKSKEQSSIKVTVGVSVTKSFASTKTSGDTNGDSSSSGDTGHQHSLLHGGAEDGDSGGSSGGSDSSGSDGGTAAPAFDPMFTARIDYGFTKKYGLGLSVGYGASSGFQDPEVGPTLKMPTGKRSRIDAALTASAPASKASQQNFKITTIKLVAGPTYEMGRFSIGLAGTVAYAWYSKTVIADGDDTQANLISTRLRSRYWQPVQGLHGGADDGDNGGSSGGGVSGPSGDNLASSDREFSRYGGRTNLGYKFNNKWRNDSSLGLAMINHQFGASTWATDATLVQISFTHQSFAAYVAVAFYKESLGIAAPTDPSASVGINYIFE